MNDLSDEIGIGENFAANKNKLVLKLAIIFFGLEINFQFISSILICQA
jgi:hypothetical protein